jgi:hypothetical protein
MNIKQFLKPNWKKIVIFVTISIIFSLIDYGISGELIIPIIGLPLPFYINYNITYPFLIIDLIVWYFISCLIVWIYDKVKKKK